MHSDFIFTLNHNVASGIGIAMEDVLMSKYVAVGVNAWRIWVKSIFNRCEWLQNFVVNDDGV